MLSETKQVKSTIDCELEVVIYSGTRFRRSHSISISSFFISNLISTHAASIEYELKIPEKYGLCLYDIDANKMRDSKWFKSQQSRKDIRLLLCWTFISQQNRP